MTFFVLIAALMLVLAAHFCVLLATDECSDKQTWPMLSAIVMDILALWIVYLI